MELCRSCKKVKRAVSDESIYWRYYNQAICAGQWKAEEAGGRLIFGRRWLRRGITVDEG